MDLKSIRRSNLNLLVGRQPSQSDAAKLLDTTSPYLSILLSGKGNIGTNMARRAEEKFGMAEGWMDVDHAGPTVTRIRLINDTDVIEMGKSLPERDATEVTFESVSASAFAFSVKGDCMSGMLFDGDVAIIDPEVKPTNSCVVLVKSGNGVFVRQYFDGVVGAPILKPANAQYPTCELTTELKIIGVVVEAQSRRKLRIAA